MEHEYCTQIFSEDTNDELDDYYKENVEKGSDELLIDAVRGYPNLYNSSLKEYKDAQMKENSWSEIGLVMNMSIADCQNRWLRLRERFAKEQRLQELENRSGSGASHRSTFSLYKNMLFLEKYIKRRRSYTNVTNFPDKKVALDISHMTDGHNGTRIQARNVFSQIHVQSPATNMFFPHSHSTSNIVTQRTNMISNKNFSCIPQNKQSNNTQTEENMADCSPILRDSNFQSKQSSIRHIDLSQDINKPESNCDILSSEKGDFSNESEKSNSSRKDSTSCILQTDSHRQTTRRISNKINKRNSTHLESSLTALSDTLNNRFGNRSSSEQNIWNNNLTADTTFGLLVATQLREIPEPEKSKRKLTIAEILWKPLPL